VTDDQGPPTESDQAATYEFNPVSTTSPILTSVEDDMLKTPMFEYDPNERMPKWVIRAIVLFWFGFLVTGILKHLWGQLDSLMLQVVISLFLAFAIEPGANRLARRGWRRGHATAVVLFGVVLVAIAFIGAIGALVASQIVDLLQNSETYIVDTVARVNDTFGTSLDPQEVLNDFNDPNGRVQKFIDAQSDKAVSLSIQALSGLLQAFTILLFTFYLVADGPRLRRSICSRLRPVQQRRVLDIWELAIAKTGGYLYSRALLALVSALFHWIVFQSLGVEAPIPLALWVGVVSQFLPVVGTYIAGILPVLITFLESPEKALIVLALIAVYQQLENYLLAPRITARTMELHPAVAFGAALAGVSVLGIAGAILALPAAAMLQAVIGGWGERHEVVESELTELIEEELGIDEEPEG
jgi:predicted PurR-regulated permease PerM